MSIGVYRDYVICQKCNYVGGRKTKFMDLQLPISNLKHIDQSIEAYQFEEHLSGSNQYFCEKCNCKVDARKGIKLLSTPDVLTLQLKRFDFNYHTLARIKVNNQLVFPHVLDMNKHLNTSSSFQSSEINAVSLDPKYNMYNLNSVVIHSGSAGGGHYYSYVKVDGNWYEFNDSTVSKISEKEIEKAFGSSQSNSNGYLLIYIRENPVSDNHKDILGMTDQEEIELIPENIRQTIQAENDKYLKGQLEFELKKAKMELNIYGYNTTGNLEQKKFEVEKSLKVSELLQMSVDHFCKGLDINEARLRLFQKDKRILGKPIADLQVQVRDLDLSTSRNTLLLEKSPFSEYNPKENLTIGLSKFNRKGFDDLHFVTFKKGTPLTDIKALIEPIVSIPVSKQVVIITKYFNNNPRNIILEGDEDIEEEYGVCEGDILYIEEFEGNELEESNALKYLIDNQNTINIEVALTGSKEKIPIPIDRRKTIKELKSIISEVSQELPDSFTLAIGEANAENECTLDNLDDLVDIHLFNGSTVRVISQHQLVQSTFKLSFFLKELVENYETVCRKSSKRPSNGHHHYHEVDPEYEYDLRGGRPNTRAARRAINNTMGTCHLREDVEMAERDSESKIPKYVTLEDGTAKFQKIFDLTLDKDITVNEIKHLLFKKAVEENSDLVQKNDTVDNIRVREKLENRDYCGRILRDEEKPFNILNSSNRQVVIERSDSPDFITPNDRIIRIARFNPSSWSLGSVKEIIIRNDTCALQLKQIILGMDDSISESSIKLVKILHPPNVKDTSYMMKLSWESDIEDGTVLCQAPWFVTDCDLILYKNSKEKSRIQNNGKSKESNAAAPKPSSDGQSRERGVRFKTKEEKEQLKREK